MSVTLLMLFSFDYVMVRKQQQNGEIVMQTIYVDLASFKTSFVFSVISNDEHCRSVQKGFNGSCFQIWQYQEFECQPELGA